MYRKSCYQCQWHNPMHNNWNNNNWSYNWNPHYSNWNNNHWNNNLNPYYGYIKLKDYGSKPFVVNIDQAAKQNNTYRTALWTGKNLQVTLMSINVGDDIGLEVHPTTDQFIRIEEGQGLVQMGDSKDKLDFQEMAYDDYAIMIPAGKWHNVTNTGTKPLKLYVIYAPPEHPYGTVHETKAIAMAAEENHHY
jgi:mannose-6-phosphate isomerase-like protein (cupin superfamily)